ncbi:hypothetical protein CI610_02716 [invertebrate metagenome]|uniref:Uncharacterized protein n=1 Tax=invertebrate metagenome TaxID=1711999 RepID=A0A2H9T546_9ZZZZ
MSRSIILCLTLSLHVAPCFAGCDIKMQLRAMLAFFIHNQFNEIVIQAGLEKKIDHAIDGICLHLNDHLKCKQSRCVNPDLRLKQYHDLSNQLQALGIDRNAR